MAYEEGSSGPEGLQPDPLAEKLVDGAAVLVGILGKGPTDEDWYLFLNRELTRRAEFKASDVLHSEKVRAEDPPFPGTQGTRVYLRRSARVVYTTTGSREVQAEFLRGAIAESSLAASLDPTAVIEVAGAIQAAARVASINPQGYATYCAACPPDGGCAAGTVM